MMRRRKPELLSRAGERGTIAKISMERMGEWQVNLQDP